MKKRKKFKIGEQKPRCLICGQRVSNYIQDSYEHISKYHLDELDQFGVTETELNMFKKGFTWEPSTNSLPV